MTAAELIAYEGRRALASLRQHGVIRYDPKGVSPVKEKELHDAILTECRRRGWYVVHCRMDRPTTVGVGTPDFIVAAPCGATFWVEAKSKRGKLTKEQQAAGAWLRKHGHTYAVVHSLQEFMEAVK